MAIGALCVIGAFASCAPEPEPVGEVRIEPHRFTLPHGAVQPVDVTWTMTRSLPDSNALVFLHLVDPEGTVRRTFDHALPGGWAPDEVRSETVSLYHSAIGPALPAGQYALVVGILDGSGERWPLRTDGTEAGRLEYALAEVEVPELSTEGPRFAFDGSWLPVEAGTDVQVVARRWFHGAASLEIAALPPEAESVWMVLRIPAPSDELRLVPGSGAGQPTILLTTDCSGFEAEVSGPGLHEIRVPVDWGGESCRLRLAPSYHLVELTSLRRLAASLEQLGYR